MIRGALRRYLHSQVESDLGRKMVFVGGPRQVGKTWLGKAVIGDTRAYLNYDIAPQRQAILRRELPPTNAWFFDEIHKYRGWRRFLKGLSDARPRGQRILVTGSARLDFYRFAGDSLQGGEVFRFGEAVRAGLGTEEFVIRDFVLIEKLAEEEVADLALPESDRGRHIPQVVAAAVGLKLAGGDAA